jgi:hypothetical protein
LTLDTFEAKLNSFIASFDSFKPKCEKTIMILSKPLISNVACQILMAAINPKCCTATTTLYIDLYRDNDHILQKVARNCIPWSAAADAFAKLADSLISEGITY